MRIPDWMFYLIVIGVILYSFGRPQDDGFDEQFDQPQGEQGGFRPDRPRAAPEVQTDGPVLPRPSPFDEQGLVDAENPDVYSTGTAFAVGPDGSWLTASHVVRGCLNVGLVSVDRETAVRVVSVAVSDGADVAWLDTNGGPEAFAMDLNEADLRLGSAGFHIGFPQGEPGEVVTRLMGRQKLETRGAWRGREDTLTWAEIGRTPGLSGSLGGLSGGPVFDAAGNVLGVTIAENPRRGRVVTTAATSVQNLVQAAGVTLEGEPAPPLSPETFTEEGDALRADRQIMQVVCLPG